MAGFARDYNAEPNWMPLEDMQRLTELDPRLPILDADYFMYGGAITQPRGPTIHLFKHYLSRRYINIDGSGHCHRYVWNGDDNDDYELIGDL